MVMVGDFLHCFCRSCGVPMWTECRLRDSAVIFAKYRLRHFNNLTTVVVNMRAINDIPREIIKEIRVESHVDESGFCVLEPSPQS